MKIVVVYATAGAGHKKAAYVIADHIRSRDTRHSVELADIVDRSSFFFKIIYLWGYDFLVNHCQWLWSLLFAMTSQSRFRPFVSRVRSWVHYYNTGPFCKFLVDAQPDAIISTHFLSSDVVSYLKNRGFLRTRLVTIITDFGVHPFWICPGTDMYCVASDATRNILIEKGASADTVCVTGIPTDPKFSRSHDRHQICTRLAIDPGRKTVLVVTGSFGIGPIEEIVRELYRDYSVLAVCARNKGLYQRLTKKSYANTHVFGFIDFIDDLMAVADVIITKPGGLTISELLCMDCIPLFIAAIPGQESVNIAVLQSAGIGCKAGDIRSIHQEVAQCIRDEGKIKNAIQAFKQQNSAARIYDALRTNSAGIAR